MRPPTPANRARPDDLLELLAEVRRELHRRQEAPAGEWVDRTSLDLRTGRRPGWYYPPSESGGGIAFSTRRGPKSWGHVHAAPGPAQAERAVALADALLDGTEPDVQTLTLGFTGLTDEVEPGCLRELRRRAGARVIPRRAMERPLSAADEAAPPLLEGLSHVPVREVRLEALADLDWRAFHGSVDDLVVGGSLEEYTRTLQGLLDNTLGRFLDEASTALYDAENARLVGALLTGEVSPREGVFLDLTVSPEARRKGIGRYLLRWGLRALRALGYSTVRLWVTDENLPARTLYEASGFVTVAATSLYRWDRPPASPQPQDSR